MSSLCRIPYWAYRVGWWESNVSQGCPSSSFNTSRMISMSDFGFYSFLFFALGLSMTQIDTMKLCNVSSPNSGAQPELLIKLKEKGIATFCLFNNFVSKDSGYSWPFLLAHTFKNPMKDINTTTPPQSMNSWNFMTLPGCLASYMHFSLGIKIQWRNT